MKIIKISNLKKEAGAKDWLIEKGKGFYDKIREVFRDSDAVNGENYAEDMIGDLKDGQFEENLSRSVTTDPEYYQVQPASISGLTKAQKTLLDAIPTGGMVRIGYLTKDYNTYIVRNVVPLYTFRAKTTYNDIVLTQSNEAQGDFRAFIINNIVSALPTESQNFGE
jgi:hypothetical protein